MKKIVLLASISLLLTGCVFVRKDISSGETKTITPEIKDTTTTTETTTTTTETTTTTTKALNYVQVGDVKLKFGTYKGIFDTNALNATIVIKADGTATYKGNIDSHGANGNYKRTGKWSTSPEGGQISDHDPNVYESISFKWSDGEEEGYLFIDDSYFGDQWHEFKFVK